MGDSQYKSSLGAQIITMPEVTDETLVTEAQAGDEQAFAQIFARHRRRVTRIVGRFFRRPERVEELVQDVFTKLYFALDYFATQKGKTFANWLTSIAINACYDELRRLQRRPESRLSDISPTERDWLQTQLTNGESDNQAETELIAKDLAAKLLQHLSAEDKLILTLLEVEGLTVNEIAEMFNWSVSKVKMRAYRARLALREILKNML